MHAVPDDCYPVTLTPGDGVDPAALPDTLKSHDEDFARLLPQRILLLCQFFPQFDRHFRRAHHPIGIVSPRCSKPPSTGGRFKALKSIHTRHAHQVSSASRLPNRRCDTNDLLLVAKLLQRRSEFDLCSISRKMPCMGLYARTPG